MLETAFSESDPDTCIKRYAERVVCCCTDQGTESLLAKAPYVPLNKVLADAAVALSTDVDLDLFGKNRGQGHVGSTQAAEELEDEVTLTPTPCLTNTVQEAASAARSLAVSSTGGTDLGVQVHQAEQQPQGSVRDEDQDEDILFLPNALSIHGIKHICDNLLGNILPELGVHLGSNLGSWGSWGGQEVFARIGFMPDSFHFQL